MKKQHLILIVAIFAISFSTAYGQVTCPVPRAVDVTCLPNDALHPIPGTAYNYTITVPTPPGTREYTWFVTTDPNFIASGILTANREVVPASTYLVATGAGYNDPLTGTATLSLTWKYFSPTIPVFVVIQVRNTDPANSCLTQNLKVYKIMPVNAFTLDIANVNGAHVTQTGYGTNIDRCVHDIVTATYDPTAPEGVIYDFGVDTLFYVVTAANFSTSWLPTIQIGRNVLATPGANMGEITDVSWTRPSVFPTGAWTAFTIGGTTYTSTAPVLALDASGTVGAAGECIIIRVIVDHSTTVSYEGIVPEQISVAVNGTTMLSLPTPLEDIHFSTTLPSANTVCGLPDGYQFDVALQTLTARPDIQSTTPAVPGPGVSPFLPIKP